MFSKTSSIKFSDAHAIKEIYPEATLPQLIKLRNSGAVEDILECKTMFPESTIAGTSAIVGSRNFVRWYLRNKKAINLLLVATPLFAVTVFGLKSAFGLQLLTHPLHTPAFPGGIDKLMPAIPNAVTSMAEPSSVACFGSSNAIMVASGASFFSGDGVILLHIMLIGFFTLIVSSFLKFTGRGDMIPLIAFIGGAIILKEVIGLFNGVYGAIKTLINM